MFTRGFRGYQALGKEQEAADGHIGEFQVPDFIEILFHGE
jgi:hypothetical protein